ncbi:MAG TPA: cache domain-containing protein [Usitatibacter sp.]|nr:cache domain-containing protein [Usitatibacter sp.]
MFAPGKRSPHVEALHRGVLGLAVLGVLLTIAVVVQSSIGERGDRLEQAGSQAAAASRAVERHVAGLLDSNGQFLVDLRSHLEAEGGIDAVPATRLEFLLGTPRLHDQATRRAFLVDGKGERRAVVSGAGRATPSMGSTSLAQRDFFLRHRADPDRGVHVNLPLRSDLDRRWVMPISVRIDGRHGDFAGVAVLALDVERLVRYFATLDLPHDASVALVGSDGRFFVRYPGFEEEVGRPVASREPTFADAQGILEGRSPVDGSPRIVAYRRVADYPLYAVVTLSRDAILQGWLRSSLLRVVAGGAVIGMIVLYTVLLLGRIEAQRGAAAGFDLFCRALDRSGDLLYWIAEDGRVLYLNERAARRFAPDPPRPAGGVTVTDIAGHTPDSWARLCRTLRQDGTARFEAEHLTHDGRGYPVDVTATFLEEGGAGYVFMVAREPARS